MTAQEKNDFFQKKHIYDFEWGRGRCTINAATWLLKQTLTEQKKLIKQLFKLGCDLKPLRDYLLTARDCYEEQARYDVKNDSKRIYEKTLKLCEEMNKYDI